jgi:thiamine biosynthesis lipoprotein
MGMPSRPPAGLGSASWRALGTGVVLRVTEPAALAAARRAVELELASIDRALSRFRADSELSLANDHAGRSLKAGPLLLEALGVALRAAVLTDGDVDPTLGRQLELIGYDRDHGALDPPRGEPAPAPTVTTRSRPGWRTIELDPRRGSFRTAPGVRLDLGATAKAWAADRAAAAAATAGRCGVLVAVGGDIATAGPPPPAGWAIRVTDDHRSDALAPGQTVRIDEGGLATSSTSVRRWSHGGRSMHHILDPRTAAPVRSRWRTASVAADTCAEANIATTAAIVRGDAARAWLESLGLPARLVAHDGAVTTVGPWPADTGSEPIGAVAA